MREEEGAGEGAAVAPAAEVAAVVDIPVAHPVISLCQGRGLAVVVASTGEDLDLVQSRNFDIS